MTDEKKAKLICGCGYLGERLARRWIADGHRVFATTRSAARAATLQQRGLETIVVDITHPFEIQAETPSFETVVSAVGFDRSSGLSIEEVYVGGLRNLLAAVESRATRFVYISSTGVYGETTGDWVDEATECHPTRAGGRACLAAENLLRNSPLGLRGIVLRLAGIYGPGRIPKLEAVKKGEPLESVADGFLNLIHVEDAVSAIVAAEHTPTPDLFTVSDGHPVLRGDFYRELARLVDAPEPQFLPPPGDSSAAARGSSDKRVSNAHLRAVLDVPFRYPSYREGLAEIVS